MSVFKNPRRKPFWQWFRFYSYGDKDWRAFGVGVVETCPAGMSFYLSFWRRHWRLEIIWDQWRDE